MTDLQKPRSPPTGKGKGFRAWYVSLGLPAASVAIGIGLAVAGGTYFWSGIYLAYTGITWLLVDWWIFSKALSFQAKIIGTIGTLIITLLVTWMAFRPAPLGIFSTQVDMNYEANQDVYGIKWNNLYSPLRTVISNESDDQYHALEIFIRTDVLIE
jgi:hypothetical protein